MKIYLKYQESDRLNKQILKSIKETSDCSLYANNEDLVCFNFGKISSNQFGSFPSIEEDEQTKDEGKKTKQATKNY